MYRAPNDHAIVVGIDSYQPGIPALKGCVNDANLFYDWLVDPNGGGLNPANVELVTARVPGDGAPPTGRPDRGEIEDLIIQGYYRHKFDTGDRKGRRVYLYFAGHGVGPPSPNDEDCGFVMGNAVPLSLRSLLSRTTAKRMREANLFEEIVLFVDCCRELTEFVRADCDLPLLGGDARVVKRIPFLYGLAAPWAAASSEKLLPHPLNPAEASLIQGVFTHCLLRGLQSATDQAGQVTSSSLRSFVRSAVQELLPTDDNDRPAIDFSEDLPLITFGIGRPTGLTVARATVGGRPIAKVIVRDGLDLQIVARQSAAAALPGFNFSLPPARYLVESHDAAGQLIAAHPLDLYGESVHVDF